jgi:hypothetical protein
MSAASKASPSSAVPPRMPSGLAVAFFSAARFAMIVALSAAAILCLTTIDDKRVSCAAAPA